MTDCMFCKIVKNEIPSYKVYEDDLFMAFLDIFPKSKGHTLIIPKKHYTWTYDVPNFGEYWEATLKVTKAIQSALKPDWVNYFTHGIEVPHAHIHILPRFKVDGIEIVPNKVLSIEDSAMKSVQHLIQNEITII